MENAHKAIYKNFHKAEKEWIDEQIAQQQQQQKQKR